MESSSLSRRATPHASAPCCSPRRLSLSSRGRSVRRLTSSREVPLDGQSPISPTIWPNTTTALRFHERSVYLDQHTDDLDAALSAASDLAESLASDPTASAVLNKALRCLKRFIFTSNPELDESQSPRGRTFREEAASLQQRLEESQRHLDDLERRLGRSEAIAKVTLQSKHVSPEAPSGGVAATSQCPPDFESPQLKSLVEENAMLHVALRKEKIAHRKAAVESAFFQAQLGDSRRMLLAMAEAARTELRRQEDAPQTSTETAVRLLRENTDDILRVFSQNPVLGVEERM